MGGPERPIAVNATLRDNCGIPWDVVAAIAPDGRIVAIIGRIAGDTRPRQLIVPDDALVAQIKRHATRGHKLKA